MYVSTHETYVAYVTFIFFCLLVPHRVVETVQADSGKIINDFAMVDDGIF